LIAPAMNDQMYTHPITQRNIAQLTAIGHRFIDPIEGDLACGREGIGHIAEDETIVAAVETFLGRPPRKK
jgi:phosphopantothenoylcysteine decarboxylase/phosphopantothenate--cysteine ligase